MPSKPKRRGVGFQIGLAFGALWILGLTGPAFGLERVPNTTLTVPAQPPVFGYSTGPAFGGLRFTDPVALVTPPGETNRLFVVEQRGRVAVISDLSAPTRSVFLDISARVAGGAPNDERGLLGLAFHPGYATNRFFFVFYSATTNGLAVQRVSRFEADPQDAQRAVSASETLLISQRDEAGNHNGGDLHFGPDGYLYVSLGDEGGQNDAYNNSQRIDKDFFSGILRIDVDRRPGNLAPNPHASVYPNTYSVPADNPWVGATEFNGRAVNPAQVRTEFWAVGLRNPWRISFDRPTGRLWVGDVGGSLREEVNVVERGGNYGWALREGSLAGPKWGSGSPDYGFIGPVAEYGRTGPFGGRSITGGVVYRGHRMSQLAEAYVFADYVSANIWAIRYDGQTASPMERLGSRAGIAAFGHDPRNGEILIADQSADVIAQLTYTTTPTGTPLPGTLAETGAFADLQSLEPSAGLVPYEVNVPFWSDDALKRRWFSVPDTNAMLRFSRDGNWGFPTGTVWVKHFEIEMVAGDPASVRRLETRFLVRNSNGVHGLTYRWTDPPTNAVLVAEEGMDEVLTRTEGGVQTTQVWRYPARSECLQCHTPAAGWALGFSTRQLHRDVDFGNGTESQIHRLAEAGYFENPPEERHTLVALAAATNEMASVEWRVRSWLDANCAACHQPGGSALGAWDGRAETPLMQTGLIDGALNNDWGDPLNRLVAPGVSEHTMLLARIEALGEGRMPPLASRVTDDGSVSLLRRWVAEELPKQPTFVAWQVAKFGSTNAPTAMADADPDGDEADNRLEYLAGTDPLSPGDAWSVAMERLPGGVRLRVPHPANRGMVVEWSDTLDGEGGWNPLDVPGNRFRIPAEAGITNLEETAAEGVRYFRARLFEP